MKVEVGVEVGNHCTWVTAMGFVEAGEAFALERREICEVVEFNSSSAVGSGTAGC